MPGRPGERRRERMNEERINTALRGATDTQKVSIDAGVLDTVDEVFEQSFGDRPAVVVADENTFAAAGEVIQQRFEDAGRRLVGPHVFPREPTLYAGYENIETLVEFLREHEAIPVAVGSGTLNDIVKRAAYECDRPYMVVATAASMDGYTAFGASIARDGYKHTMTCPAPRAVLADLEVLVEAPPEMTSAGYADLLGKVTAGADWLIADALGVEEIDPAVWSLVQGSLREWIGKPAELNAGDQDVMESLIEGLIMSGLAMQAAASSRPASGAEHLFSHLWEMEGLGHGEGHEGPPLSHGFKVGVGSVAVAALYERILERDLGNLNVEEIVRTWPSQEEMEQSVRSSHETPGLDEAAVEESRAKYVSAGELTRRLELLRERWPVLSDRLTDQLLPASRLRDMLQAAGCPVSPSEIGLSVEAFEATYFRAQTIRRRYTVLDLAKETGILEGCVEELFVSGGFPA